MCTLKILLVFFSLCFGFCCCCCRLSQGMAPIMPTGGTFNVGSRKLHHKLEFAQGVSTGYLICFNLHRFVCKVEIKTKRPPQLAYREAMQVLWSHLLSLVKREMTEAFDISSFSFIFFYFAHLFWDIFSAFIKLLFSRGQNIASSMRGYSRYRKHMFSPGFEPGTSRPAVRRLTTRPQTPRKIQS